MILDSSVADVFNVDVIVPNVVLAGVVQIVGGIGVIVCVMVAMSGYQVG